uniref:hypothetical protein n=1 Tax=Mariniflexile sp. TaxID=1979402 RepID=UPI0040476A10
MIDLISAKLTKKEKMEIKLLADKDKYIVEGKYSYSDDEKIYPIRSRMENLFINVTAKGATIENSLHKYFNSLVSSENQNYNDFYFSDIVYALDVLEAAADYPLEETILTNLEFGFNTDLSICPTKFLNHNVLMHNLKAPCYDPKNDKKMKIKKYTYSEYEVKLYNKTLDHSRFSEFRDKLKGTKILRVEIKYKSKKLLNKFGIFNLADLKKPSVYSKLMEDFLKKYEDLLIIDSYNGNSLMSKKERQFIMQCTHPNYWIELKDNTHSNTSRNHKKRLEKLMKKYELDTWKNNLKKDLVSKFNQLMMVEAVIPINTA